jgi:hypothetical protein
MRKPILPFTLQPQTPKAFGVDFLKKIRPGKNRENFDILNNHNMLSARCLQKKAETSIYNNAEMGKASAVAAAAMARPVRRRGQGKPKI